MLLNCNEIFFLWLKMYLAYAFIFLKLRENLNFANKFELIKKYIFWFHIEIFLIEKCFLAKILFFF